MKTSAGILLYRQLGHEPEVLLVHPGGPFFARKDAGWWTIPKGEYTDEETAQDAAIREFEEETGYRPAGPFRELGSIRQKGGKTVYCWAAAGDFDTNQLHSNTFTIEWPPRSGKQASFPEVDRAEWMSVDTARGKINEQQAAFLDRLMALLASQ
ncbi:NUDIX domain-containing protein [Deminuibacter soli]|uniref:NUDIX domain-containing protein n=1 Tax=Deminuibacter soli TaxID=2291815 RepID=A0A3E1NGA2_9BACT|nr:NUDIX domain-containing protein [Deminuibacter soli]RFM26979.1 NUDIX domain-containing protein [Deminuibacter soli]